MKGSSPLARRFRDVSPIEGFLSSATRYDLLLAVVPIAFLLALVAAELLPVPREVLLVAASVVGILAIVDGVFRNPPFPGGKAA